MTNCTYLSHTEFRDFLQKKQGGRIYMRYAGMPMEAVMKRVLQPAVYVRL